MAFDVLSLDLNLSHSYFLEASAGTGKTFAIENIVARLLLFEKELSLEEILVVTFTQAATADLRDRIRKQLIKLIECLETSVAGPFSYLQPLIESSDLERTHAILQLRRALIHFSESFICTIHGFCARMLNEHAFLAKIPLKNLRNDTLLSQREYIKNLLLHLDETVLTPAQMARLLGSRPLDALVDDLLPLISSRLPIIGPQNCEEHFLAFSQQFQKLPKEILVDSLLKHAPYFQSTTSRNGELKSHWQKQIAHLESLLSLDSLNRDNFEQLLYQEPCFLEFLKAPLKKKAPLLPSPILQLTNALDSVWQAGDRTLLLIQLASYCAKKRREAELDKDPDVLLWRMEQALAIPEFVQAIQERFSVIIVDEFQDTDPIQWQIFWKCFEKKRLFLVGDPKQSIYAFRQADLYTYLRAKTHFSDDSFAVLDTNFRSQPALISALNALFATDWMDLPKWRRFLPVHPVKTPPERIARWPQETPCVWMVAEAMLGRSERWPTVEMEEQLFFPYITQEILRLKTQGALWLDFACLVRDRFQKERLASFFETHGIPYQTTRENSITDTGAFATLEAFLLAAFHKEERFDRLALSAPLLHLPIHDIYALAPTIKAPLYEAYACIENNEGLAAFGSTVVKLAGFSKDPALLDQFWQCIRLLIQTVSNEKFSSPFLLWKHLQNLRRKSTHQHSELLLPQEEQRDAVKILTLHSSKGLEFPIVFALALASRTPQEELLIPCNNHSALVQWKADSEEGQAFIAEKNAEKMRQLYVACTRAKEKLYIAYAEDTSYAEVAAGHESPSELFLAKHQQTRADFWKTLPEGCTIERLVPQSIEIVPRPLEDNTLPVTIPSPLSLVPIASYTLKRSLQQLTLLRWMKILSLNKIQKVSTPEQLKELLKTDCQLLWTLFFEYTIDGHLLSGLPSTIITCDWPHIYLRDEEILQGPIDLTVEDAEKTLHVIFLGEYWTKHWKQLYEDFAAKNTSGTWKVHAPLLKSSLLT